MGKANKEHLKQNVILGAREYGIGSVLFRHAIGERLGVGVTDMECLGLIFLKGYATPSELAFHTGLTSGSTTAMLDRLQKSNLIKRQPNPKDRRSSHIVLVEETARAIAPMFDSLRKAQDDIVSRYTEEELELLADFFSRSNEVWEAERKKLEES